MGARTNLVINDRAATPVAHTFVPDGNDANGVLVFTEKTGVPAGEARFTLSQSSSNGKLRPRLKFLLPVLVTETINGVTSPRVSRTAHVNMEFVFDELSTEQERKDAVGFAYNTLAASQTMINDLLTKQLQVY